MKILHEVMVCALIGVLTSNSAKAQSPCKPDAFLKRNYLKETTDYRVALAYFDLVNKFESDKQSADLGIIYNGVPIGLKEASDLASAYSKRESLGYSSSFSQSIYMDQLSEVGLEAYRLCINATPGVILLVDPDAGDKDFFGIHVYWKPPGSPPPAKLTVTWSQKGAKPGEIIERHKVFEKFGPGGDQPLSINRDPTKEIIISASINLQGPTVVVPRKPTEILLRRTYNSAIHSFALPEPVPVV